MSVNKNILKISALLFGAFFISITACDSDNDDFDTDAPTLSVDFPRPCDTVYLGEEMRFKASFADNEAVKSYKLNMHHNFDHHTHGDHEEICHMDEIKTANKPFLKNWVVNLSEGESITTDTSFTIPKGYDEGDYHVLLYITDINGNQGWTGISVKLMSKESN